MSQSRQQSKSSESAPSAPSPSSLWLLWPLIVAVVATRAAGSVVFPKYDDAFITYRYAHHLAEGIGFVYNPGEWVLGITAPMFGLLAALLDRLGVPIPTGISIVNTLCDVGVLVMVYRLLTRRDAADVFVWFGLLFAGSPILVRISTGGMEANLYLLMSLVVATLASTRAVGVALVVAAAVIWIRPEGVILLAFVSLLVVRSWRSRSDAIADAIPVAAAACVVIVPAAVLYATYGNVLPHSIVAKAELEASLWSVWSQLIWPDPLAVALVPLGLLGVRRMWRTDRAFRFLLIWSGLYLAAYVIRRPAVWSWYAAPIQCMLVLAAGFGIATLLSFMRSSRLQLKPVVWSVAGSIVVVAAWALIAATRNSPRIYQDMRSWVEADELRDRTVLALDIGAIGYFSDAYIWDAAGLVWKDWSNYRSVQEMIIDKKPDFVMINAIRGHIWIMIDRDVRRNYTPVVSFPIGRAISLDPMDYPEEWRQEYLLFKRTAEPWRNPTP